MILENDNDPNASDDAIRVRASNMSHVPVSSRSTVWRNNPASKARSEIILSSYNDVTIH